MGPSETIGGSFDLFDIFDKKWKFFQRKELTSSAYPAVEFPPVVSLPANATKTVENETEKRDKIIRLSDLIERILLDNYAPPCVIINQKHEILYIHGRTGRYLEPASGEARMNVLEMAREGLKIPLQHAIRKCLSQNSDVTVRNVQVKLNDGSQSINLSVKPIHSPIYEDGLLTILFEEIKLSEETKKSRGKSKGGEDYRGKRIRELEQELKYTRENLQTTIEELETSNEELKSTNEELQSANEELQSTNEELETSKEETQSLNEELVTLNSELQIKIDELMQINSDMKNLVDSTQIATIFLDNDLKIKRFTRDTTKVINLIDSDIGRPISHIASNLLNDNSVEDIKGVLRYLISVEKEVQTKDGHWYIMRILPYRTISNVIDGVVITFIGINEQKKASQAANNSRLWAESIVDTIREPLLILDSNLCVVSANRSFYNKFLVDPQDSEKKLIYEIGNRQWDIPKLRELLEKVISQNTVFNDFEVEHEFEHIGRRTMLLNGRSIEREGDSGKLILLAIEDVTERKMGKN